MTRKKHESDMVRCTAALACQVWIRIAGQCLKQLMQDAKSGINTGMRARAWAEGLWMRAVTKHPPDLISLSIEGPAW